MPHTVRRRTCPARPAASPQNVANDGAVKHGRSAPSSTASEAGRVTSGSIGGSPVHRQISAPPMLPRSDQQITHQSPEAGRVALQDMTALTPAAPKSAKHEGGLPVTIAGHPP